MSDLVSMLAPLQTMPGWPNAQNPSITFWFFVMVAIPIALLLVVSLIGNGPRLVRAARGAQITADESHWLGSGSMPQAIGPSDGTASGGASERW